jgi:very-short-patch-repair endonuclease
MNLNIFNTTNLFEAATNLFQQLNIKLNSNTAEPLPTKDILKHHYKDNDTFKAIDKTFFIGIIDDSVFKATGMPARSAGGFDIHYSYKEAIEQGDKNYNGLMLFALELIKQPTRTEIAELTRAFNRISQKMPVALLLKYTVANEAVISIAISERFKYLQNWRQGEKAGKVIMLRDIHTQNTHTGHTRILQDLVKPVGVSTYEQLHQHWLQVLDVSILNKKFFQDLSNWYFSALNEVSFPDDLEKKKEVCNATNLIRLITRVIFIWFIKEKQLVPASLFRKDFVANILKDFNKNKNSHNYYNAILQNLFFGTLNQKMDERKFAKDGDFRTNKEEYGVKNLFRYADLFTIPEKEVLALFKDVPFLNGGLFDCLDKPNDEGKIEYVDGFSRNPKKKAIIPDYIFFGEEKEVDLNEVYGTKNKRYSSRGLINLLESYKFTVAENTPIEEEIALDPELLGKVFENLLASYNPETQTTARKQTGSFYTPREIVNYMVDESLFEYIKQSLKNSPPFQGGVPEGGGGLNIQNQVPEGGGGLNIQNQVTEGGDGLNIQNQVTEGGDGLNIQNQVTEGGDGLNIQNQVPEGGDGLNIQNQVPEGGDGLNIQNQVPEGGDGLNNLPYLKTFRKELRNNLTPAEAKLWKFLQGKQLDGRKFRRQHSVSNYILDFYCPEEKLAVELDGQGHFEASQAEYDAERDLFLKHCGIKVLRFENKWVWENLEGLLDEIKSNFGWDKQLPRPSETPPFQGEDLFESRLRDVFSYSENPNPFNEAETIELIEAINNCKILDPACGSGAFPMGILHKMVHILQKLDPENKYWKDLQRKKAIEETEAAFKIGDKEERAKRLAEINDVFENNASDYGRKLYLIENCIYGIDIQPIAVQIAKLRFFISLVIDQKVDKTKENFGIRSLPNLETKFVAANTLIGLDKPQQLTLRNPEIEAKENELKQLRHKYFTANTRKEKITLQKQDKELRKQIAELLENDGWNTTVAKQIASFDPYDQNHFANWFDPEWMFGITDGFDIVIGNPPYIQLQKDGGKLAEEFKNKGYQTYNRMGDIYTLFYEKGISLLKQNGILAYITSNKWMRAGYGENLRKFFTKYNPLVLIDLGPGVFESATVDTNILIIQKLDNTNNLRAVTISNNKKENIDFTSTLQNEGVTLKKLTQNAWTISSDIESRIKEKIEAKGTPLKDWDVKINYGIKTGFNDAFIIDGKKKDELIAQDPKSAEIIKPILRGRDIKRYKAEFADLWLIATFPALKLNIDDYPAIRDYLKSFGKKLHQTGEEFIDENGQKVKTRKKTGNKWFETQDQIAYYEEFEKEKIVYQELTQGSRFAFDDRMNYYVANTAYLITGKELKYLFAYLNSKFAEKSFSNYYSTSLGEGSIRWLNQYMMNFPIPKLSLKEQQPFIELVDKILQKKEKDEDTTDLEKQIDQLVYKLYDLTEEEIAIIENSFNKN